MVPTSRQTGDRDRQRVAVDIGRRGEAQRVFADSSATVIVELDATGRVVDRRDVDGRAGVDGRRAVRHRVAERGRRGGQLIGRRIELQPSELRGRQHLAIGDRRAVGERDGADRRQTGHGDGQCIAVDIGRCGKAQRRVVDSSATVIVELEATGASLTGVTLIVVPAFTVTVPSDTE